MTLRKSLLLPLALLLIPLATPAQTKQELNFDLNTSQLKRRRVRRSELAAVILKAGPKHEVRRSNSVGEPVYASPAIANGNIFIRGEKHLLAIGR